MSGFLNRLTIILPAARRAGTVAWLVGGLGSDWAGAFSSPLVPAAGPSDAPATHYWASFACTDLQVKALLARLTDQTGISVPEDWDSFDRAERKTWIDSQRAAIVASIGVDVNASFNDSDDWDVSDGLAVLGLKVQVGDSAL